MENSILSDRRLIIFFAAWWFLWTLLQYIILRQLNYEQEYAIVDSLISNLLLALSCYLISNNMKYYLPRKEKYWYILVVSLSASFLWMLVLKGIVWVILSNENSYVDNFQSTWGVRFGAGFLLISSMSMFSLMWYSQHEQQETDKRRLEIERLNKESELFKLRQQLQPHFLFNSLNSISALTGSDPGKARHMIHQLSDFLRGTLKKDEQQWNTLDEEIQYLNLYLEIEKVRFGYRLQTQIDNDEDAKSMKLPALILQPVVENAIKFGLYDTTGEVLIQIKASCELHHLLISIKNPFDAATSQPMHGTGFGLSSIRRRLFLLFGRNDLLYTHNENNQFITVLHIPQMD